MASNQKGLKFSGKAAKVCYRTVYNREDGFFGTSAGYRWCLHV